jgi:hypothetical protein
MSWKEDFRRFAFRMNFQLYLTRPMMEMLCAIADDVIWDRGVLGVGTLRGAPDNSFATTNALEKRGLIERKKHRPLVQWHSVYEIKAHHVLTPAGRALVDLLKVCGVFTEAENARHRKAAKRA